MPPSEFDHVEKGDALYCKLFANFSDFLCSFEVLNQVQFLSCEIDVIESVLSHLLLTWFTDSAMELALSLEKLTNQKLLSLHGVIIILLKLPVPTLSILVCSFPSEMKSVIGWFSPVYSQVAEQNKDPQLADFIESEFLYEQVNQRSCLLSRTYFLIIRRTIASARWFQTFLHSQRFDCCYFKESTSPNLFWHVHRSKQSRRLQILSRSWEWSEKAMVRIRNRKTF